MSLAYFISGRYAEDAVSHDPRETARRLYVPSDSLPSDIGEYIGLVKRNSSFDYAAVDTHVKLKGDGIIDLGFGDFRSFDLERNLFGCDAAIILGVTLGIGVDRLLMKYSSISSAKYFILDAVSSSLCEALRKKLTDSVRNDLGGEFAFRPCFSPGYGDLSLDIQPGILSLLRSEKTLGITLNDAFMMTPQKSITTIMGL